MQIFKTQMPLLLQLASKRSALVRASAAGLAAFILGGCGTYEPPKPGTHRMIGRAQGESEMTCGYETPTASRFMGMRCRNTAEAQRTGEMARDQADSIRTAPPDVTR